MSLARGISLVIIILAIVFGYRWWASDERAIRNQMSAIAESLTIEAGEADLRRVSRIATLRNALGPNIVVSGSAPAAAGAAPMPQQVAGRDAVLALVGRWVPPPGGVTVEFVDVQVAVADSGSEADAYCTATVTTGAASDRPSIDARELTAGFSKIDGTWVVTSVRLQETLAR